MDSFDYNSISCSTNGAPGICTQCGVQVNLSVMATCAGDPSASETRLVAATRTDLPLLVNVQS
jgi:hypothetical protein